MSPKTIGRNKILPAIKKADAETLSALMLGEISVPKIDTKVATTQSRSAFCKEIGISLSELESNIGKYKQAFLEVINQDVEASQGAVLRDVEWALANSRSQNSINVVNVDGSSIYDVDLELLHQIASGTALVDGLNISERIQLPVDDVLQAIDGVLMDIRRKALEGDQAKQSIDLEALAQAEPEMVLKIILGEVLLVDANMKNDALDLANYLSVNAKVNRLEIEQSLSASNRSSLEQIIKQSLQYFIDFITLLERYKYYSENEFEHQAGEKSEKFRKTLIRSTLGKRMKLGSSWI